jgi:two-component system, OmpR family, response regulator RegX3
MSDRTPVRVQAEHRGRLPISYREARASDARERRLRMAAVDDAGEDSQSATVGGADGRVARGAPRVLVVEDEQSIVAPFVHALARNGFDPAVARTAADALRMARELAPDVVLLDLTLPDGDGRDVCRELRRESNVPIIMLTARGTQTDRIVGLELGADDYVVKPFAIDEVIARIRAVLRRYHQGSIVPDTLTVGELRVDRAARRAWLGESELSLARKEFDLLARLAADAGHVVTREILMSEVWDENWFGSTKTLDVHIAWLRKKLGDDPAAPRHIHTVRGVGFRLAAAEESQP